MHHRVKAINGRHTRISQRPEIVAVADNEEDVLSSCEPLVRSGNVLRKNVYQSESATKRRAFLGMSSMSARKFDCGREVKLIKLTFE